MSGRWVSWIFIYLLLFIPVVSGCAALSKGGGAKGGAMDKLVCVYAGSGAVLARDVEVALDKLDMPYREEGEQDIRDGGLEDCSLLIIPGGYTAKYVDVLGEEGFEQIREFVAGGGGYISICAGAYIAARNVEVPGRPPGLGIIEIRNEREAGRDLRTLTIAKPEHPVVKGYAGEVDIWYQNGPMMKAGEGVETLAIYREGAAAIVCANYARAGWLSSAPTRMGAWREGLARRRPGR
jgi:glutamine amidotransferase PdxT